MPCIRAWPSSPSDFAAPFFYYFFARKIIRDCSLPTTTTNILKRLDIIWLFFYRLLQPYDSFAAFDLVLLGPLKITYWNLARVASQLIPLTASYLNKIFHSTKSDNWSAIFDKRNSGLSSSYKHCFCSFPKGSSSVKRHPTSLASV